MQKLAAYYDIDILWFYGVPGHGRRLVDAMSSFGCKGPLQRAILDEIYFNTASEMYNFLSKYFETDNTKSYFLIEEEETTLIRRKGKKA